MPSAAPAALRMPAGAAAGAQPARDTTAAAAVGSQRGRDWAAALALLRYRGGLQKRRQPLRDQGQLAAARRCWEQGRKIWTASLAASGGWPQR